MSAERNITIVPGSKVRRADGTLGEVLVIDNRPGMPLRARVYWTHGIRTWVRVRDLTRLP
jgi:hypothetical protein